MKITHFNNSFIEVSGQGQQLICDPWVGKANAGGWQSFPKFSYTALREYFAKARWIYISHLHDDHFHPETLQRCGLLDRDFIIKRFQSPVLKDRLRRLGVTRIHEIDPFEVRHFGPFELMIFPQMASNTSELKDDVNYELDTSIAIKTQGAVFFNQVDNPLSLENLKIIKVYISKHLGSIDFACASVGASSEYPHCFLGIDRAAEKLRIVEHSLSSLGASLQILKPTYFFPAGGTYLIPGWMSVLNDLIAQPDFDEISKYIDNNQESVNPILIEGGGFIELNIETQTPKMGTTLSQLPMDREAAIRLHSSDSYDYEDLAAPEWNSLLALLEKARENWDQKISKEKIPIQQTIRFEVYNQLRLSGAAPEISSLIGSYSLNQATTADAGTLVIHIDHRALFGCITRHLSWNGMLGALCLYDRVPNRYHPTDFFSLNFLTLSKEQLKASKLGHKSPPTNS